MFREFGKVRSVKNDFDEWADIYDRVYSYVTEDIHFYVDEALNIGGTVLELGCGTGRVCIPIADTGADVVGLDLSSSMIKVAKRKSKSLMSDSGSLTLIQGDMRNFSLDTVFDLIVIPFRGFLSLLSVSDQIDTFNSIKRHMDTNTRLIFNMFVPDNNMLVQDSDVAYHLRDVTDPVSGSTYTLWNQSHCDNYNQIIDTRLIIDELDNRGVVSQRIYRDFQIRYSHRWEIDHLLARCGFTVVDLFGGFDRSVFDEFSSEMVWVVVLDRSKI